jgi:hypothetical protein
MSSLGEVVLEQCLYQAGLLFFNASLVDCTNTRYDMTPFYCERNERFWKRANPSAEGAGLTLLARSFLSSLKKAKNKNND